MEGHVGVLHALDLLRAFQERHVEHISTGLSPSQRALRVHVPANRKGVLPPAKHGIPRPRVENDLPPAALHIGSRHVANLIRVVQVRAPRTQREPQLLERPASGVHELRLLPLDPAELAREVRAAVPQVVALLERDVAAPVADLDVALKRRDVQHGLRELEAGARRRAGAGGLLVEGPVDELGTLLLRVLADAGVVGDVARGELDLGLLLRGRVGGLAVGGEVVGEVLLVVLVYRRGERGVALGVVEGDADGLLGGGTEGFGQSDAVVLGITVGEVLSVLARA